MEIFSGTLWSKYILKSFSIGQFLSTQLTICLRIVGSNMFKLLIWNRQNIVSVCHLCEFYHSSLINGWELPCDMENQRELIFTYNHTAKKTQKPGPWLVCGNMNHWINHWQSLNIMDYRFRGSPGSTDSTPQSTRAIFLWQLELLVYPYDCCLYPNLSADQPMVSL